MFNTDVLKWTHLNSEKGTPTECSKFISVTETSRIGWEQTKVTVCRKKSIDQLWQTGNQLFTEVCIGLSASNQFVKMFWCVYIKPTFLLSTENVLMRLY